MSLLHIEAFKYLGVILKFNFHSVVSNTSKSEGIKCALSVVIFFFSPETALSASMQLA